MSLGRIHDRDPVQGHEATGVEGRAVEVAAGRGVVVVIAASRDIEVAVDIGVAAAASRLERVAVNRQDTAAVGVARNATTETHRPTIAANQ